jgi:hypothetical protein
VVECAIDHEGSLEDGRTTVTIIDRPDGVEITPRLLEVELSGN